MFYFFNYLNSFKFTLDGKVCPFNIQSLLTVVVRKVFMKTALSGWCLSLGIYVIYSNFSLSLLFFVFCLVFLQLRASFYILRSVFLFVYALGHTFSFMSVFVSHLSLVCLGLHVRLGRTQLCSTAPACKWALEKPPAAAAAVDCLDLPI